jgi:hypothetical protein
MHNLSVDALSELFAPLQRAPTRDQEVDMTADQLVRIQIAGAV